MDISLSSTELPPSETATALKRGPGRPKGSKNKDKNDCSLVVQHIRRPVGRPVGSGPKQREQEIERAQLIACGESLSPVVKRKPGRPRKRVNSSDMGVNIAFGSFVRLLSLESFHFIDISIRNQSVQVPEKQSLARSNTEGLSMPRVSH